MNKLEIFKLAVRAATMGSPLLDADGKPISCTLQEISGLIEQATSKKGSSYWRWRDSFAFYTGPKSGPVVLTAYKKTTPQYGESVTVLGVEYNPAPQQQPMDMVY